MNINSVLTNSEKVKRFNGKLLDEDHSIKILSEWANEDNILKYENIIHKLKLENMTLVQFATILNCNVDMYDLDIKTMEWHKIYIEMLSLNKNNNKFELYANDSVFYMLNMFVNWAKVKVEDNIYKYKNIKISSDCINIIIKNIGINLTNICSKTIIYEYYDQKHNIFKKFNIENFSEEECIKSFLEKYPVMLRRLCIKTKFLVENYLESLKRIDEDYKDIKLIYGISNVISNIKGNLGDTHAGGKFVIEYEFNNNTKLIYKPKNLFIAKKFYELIAWINKSSNLEKLAIPQIYYNEFYTIEEYIDRKQCEDYDEIKRFYKRVGQLIGLVYHLKGNDFHHENIIASGEQPYLIDLETLFVHSFKNNVEDIFDVISLNFEESINCMSFLPSNTAFKDKNGQGIDISALSYNDQKLPFKILQLVGDINNPKFEYKEFNVKAQDNIPIINNNKINYSDYKNEIVKGFKDINLFILENKIKFLDKINIFKDIKVRQLMRNTYDYCKILEYASHPKYTSNMKSFEKILYTLWNSEHYNKSMVTSEIEDMLVDDVPIFNTITTSRDLIDSKNNIIKDYFKTSAFEHVIAKITNFNNDELNKQLDYLNIALNNSEYIVNEINRKNNDLFNITTHNIFDLDNNLNLENEVINIYNLIENEAIIFGEECIFEHYFEHNIQISVNYQNGLSGILKYLLELNKFTKEPINIVHSIQKTLLNEKTLLLPQFKSIDNWVDIIDISVNNTYIYDDKRLEIINMFLENLKNKIKYKQLNLKEIVKSIKLTIKLYQKDNVYKYKTILWSLNELLENEILKSGINSLNELSDIGVSDVLKCINDLNNLGIININSAFIPELNSLNSNIISRLLENDTNIKYNFNEFKNILRFLNSNLNNNEIKFLKLKKIVIDKINFNTSNENLILVIDILINFLNKQIDVELESLLHEKILKLANYKFITDKYPIKNLNYFKNLSLENGLSGIGYIFLRYKNKSMISILDLI